LPQVDQLRSTQLKSHKTIHVELKQQRKDHDKAEKELVREAKEMFPQCSLNVP
jgi:hypothetical protein